MPKCRPAPNRCVTGNREQKGVSIRRVVTVLIRSLIPFAALIGVPCLSVAEVLVMPNGDRIEGKPLGGETEGRMRFASANFGIIDLPLGVARVEQDQPKSLAKPDSTIARAPVYREGWGGNAILQGTSLLAEERTPMHEPVSWYDHWNHRVTGGIIHQNAQVDVTSYLIYLESVWRGHFDELRGLFDYMYVTQRNVDGSTVNVGNRLKAETRLRHNLDTDFFSETFGRYRRDIGQGIGRRVTLAQGLGYRYLNTSNVRAAVIVGGAARSDYYLNVTGNDTRYRPFGYCAEEMEWRITEQVTFRHELSLSEKIDTPEATGIDCGLELELALTRRFGVSFRYALNYDIDRLIGVDRYQELYSTGIVFRF